MFKKQHPEAGARPGTLNIPAGALEPQVRVIRYGPGSVHEENGPGPATRLHESGGSERPVVTWIDIQGLGDAEFLQAIAARFNLHPLALEDIVNVPQRPKAESYDAQLLIIARVVTLASLRQINSKQVSIVLGPDYVVTFQEEYDDQFAPVRRRIERPTSRLRRNGSDYLAYALLDTVVDAYYPPLEVIGDQLEALEEEVVDRPTPVLLKRLNLIKNWLANLRRDIWPQREAVNRLVHDDQELLSDAVRLFLRDTYDHCNQTSEVVEMYRETATGLMNTYLSSVAHRTNEIMKTLTIMSSVFIPLTFLAGIYGMNFEGMPELKWRWAYPAVWGTMFALAGGMLWYFRRRGWIGNGRREKTSPAGTAPLAALAEPVAYGGRRRPSRRAA